MLIKRACDRPLQQGLVKRYLITPTESTRVAPIQTGTTASYWLMLSCRSKCDCCVTGHGLLSLRFPIHFQVPPSIIHPINHTSSTVDRPPLSQAGPALLLSALTACLHAPAGPTKSGIACAYFRLPAAPAVATAAVIDACTRQVCPRPRVSESASRYVRCLLPSTPRPLSLPLAHRLRSCSRCHHPDSSTGTSRASLPPPHGPDHPRRILLAGPSQGRP